MRAHIMMGVGEKWRAIKKLMGAGGGGFFLGGDSDENDCFD